MDSRQDMLNSLSRARLSVVKVVATFDQGYGRGIMVSWVCFSRAEPLGRAHTLLPGSLKLDCVFSFAICAAMGLLDCANKMISSSILTEVQSHSCASGLNAVIESLKDN